MKNSTFLITLISTLYLSLNAQTTVNFTAEEGFTDGALYTQTGWDSSFTGNTWVVNSTLGAITLSNDWQRAAWGQGFSVSGAGESITFRADLKFLGTFGTNNNPLIKIGFSSSNDVSSSTPPANVVFLRTATYNTQLQLGNNVNSGPLSPNASLQIADCQATGESDDLAVLVTLTLGTDAASSTISSKLMNLTDGTETVIGSYTGINSNVYSAATNNIYGFLHAQSLTTTGSNAITQVQVSSVTMAPGNTLNCALVSAPTGDAQQSFDTSATVADLSATGDNLQWYDAATGGNLLDNSTTLTNGQVVYASQTVNGCESTERLEVTVVISPSPQIIPSYVPTDGLVEYWPFNGNANDVTGNGNNGTVNGATLTNDRDGNENSSYSFDGVDDYIELNNSFFGGSNSVGSFTIYTLLKVSSYNNGTIFGKEGYWRTIRLQNVTINNKNVFWFGGSQPSPQQYFNIQSNSEFELNRWYNLIITFNDGELKMFVDGELDNSKTISLQTLDWSFLTAGNSTSTNHFGRILPVNGNHNYFSGEIDDFGIWNRVLTEQEIANLNTSNSDELTPITDANFNQAIETCLSTNPIDGMCSESEYGAMPDWDVSQVTDMNGAFYDRNDFNADIGSWDVSSVTDMGYMFWGASSFNQDISNWDVSSVAYMNRMFLDAYAFNQPIGDWDVSSVTDMSWMFFNLSSFNQDLGAWDVSSVIDMSSMFVNAQDFNQDISNWDVSSVTNMNRMFINSISFNQPIGDWDVGNVSDMSSMFNNASSFNQPIGNWDMSGVTEMNGMFYNAASFNQDISNWCVTNITSEPSDFSDFSPLTESNKPVWGTCPSLPYEWINYGTRDWTVENAEMVTYRDGTPIPQVTDNTEWANLTTGAWCYYDNDPTKGKLYNWYAVMGIHDNDPNTQNKELAPEGWHVPNYGDWIILETYLIINGYNYDQTSSENKIAKAMASTTGWNISTTIDAVGNDQSLNNSSGFNAFPVGFRNYNGSFDVEGTNAVFWGFPALNPDNKYIVRLNFDNSSFTRGIFLTYGQRGNSIRFVRDAASLSTIDFYNSIIIYPNPVKNMLTIDGLVVKDVVIYSVLGKAVLNISNQNTIDVSSLSKGVYFIKVSDGINASTKKFIKE